MKELYLLTDYHDSFEEKYTAKPYRSGMDKEKLHDYFRELGWNIKFSSFSEVDLSDSAYKDRYVLYTSIQDRGLHYKQYIEDVIYALELSGAKVIPSFKFLRSTNNKVFMEMLRDLSGLSELQNLKSRHFGALEDLLRKEQAFSEKKVVKPAAGSKSEGVQLVNNPQELLSAAQKVSATPDWKYSLWEMGRSYKHSGYLKESTHRKKFIVQDFVKGLENDWKVLALGSKFFVLFRGNRKGDFRASGSGDFQFVEELPSGMLDFAKTVYKHFNVPNLSMDVGFNGENFFILEFQAVSFGTSTLEKSPFHFQDTPNGWEVIRGTSEWEREYVRSVVEYLDHLPV